MPKKRLSSVLRSRSTRQRLRSYKLTTRFGQEIRCRRQAISLCVWPLTM